MGWAHPHPSRTLQLGIAEDWRAWDNLEGVTIESRRRSGPAGNAPPVTGALSAAPATSDFGAGTARLDAGDTWGVVAAKKRSLSRRELAASQGAYRGDDRVWLIPAMLLPEGVGLKPGDVVTDAAGTRWVALEAALNRLGHTWRLVCRDPVIAYDLSDSVSIERAEITHDAAGFPRKDNWRAVYPALRCRVQPQRREYAEQRGIEGTLTRYDVFVERELNVSMEDRVAWGEVYLEVRGYRQAEELGQLPVLECERVP